MFERGGGKSGKRNRRGDFFQTRVAGDITIAAPSCADRTGSTRSISSIGRIPAIASFEKGKLSATAPASLPSIYTGDPLMPCITPVLASGPPFKRPRMIDSLGARFSSTPRISTSKFLDARARENRASDSVLSRPNVFQRKNNGSSMDRGGNDEPAEKTERQHVFIVVVKSLSNRVLKKSSPLPI